MTYKQLEASREARLWLGQVVIPAATAVFTITTIPEVRGAIKAKATEIKYEIERRIKK